MIRSHNLTGDQYLPIVEFGICAKLCFPSIREGPPIVHIFVYQSFAPFADNVPQRSVILDCNVEASAEETESMRDVFCAEF